MSSKKGEVKQKKRIFALFLLLNVVLTTTILIIGVWALTSQFSGGASDKAQVAGEKGFGLLAAAIATGLATIGAGYAVGHSSAAGITALVENPGLFGRALIFIALGEGIAIYGLLVTFIIIGLL